MNGVKVTIEVFDGNDVSISSRLICGGESDIDDAGTALWLSLSGSSSEICRPVSVLAMALKAIVEWDDDAKEPELAMRKAAYIYLEHWKSNDKKLEEAIKLQEEQKSDTV